MTRAVDRPSFVGFGSGSDSAMVKADTDVLVHI